MNMCFALLLPWTLHNKYDLSAHIFQLLLALGLWYIDIDITDQFLQYIDSLVQDCSNPNVFAIELLQSWAKPLICILI